MADLETRVTVLEVRMDGVQNSGERVLAEVHNVRDVVGNVQDRLGVVESRLGVVENQLIVVEGRLENVENRLGVVENRLGDMRVEMERRFGELGTAMHKEFALVHREIANQTKFLLALALGAATVVSILQPLFQKVLAHY